MHTISKSNLLEEKDFRWRGTEVTRIEAFTDAVFAFAVTLLVVALEVPHTFHELTSAIKGFPAFAICFTLLVMVWHDHVKFFRRYGLQTTKASVLNSALLFVVLFYVYPLKFLFTLLVGLMTRGALLPHGMESAPMVDDINQVPQLMILYGLGYAAVFLILFLLYRHAYGLRVELELNEVEVHLTKAEMIHHFAMVCFGLASALIAFLLPARLAGLAGYLYGGIGIYYWIAGTKLGKKKREIVARMEIALTSPTPAAGKS